eukprot:3514688-Karenia_brevis.AAC.1
MGTAKVERLMAEEMHRIENKPMGAYLQPAPQPKMPVKAMPVVKRNLKEISRAKASVPTPTTAQ